MKKRHVSKKMGATTLSTMTLSRVTLSIWTRSIVTRSKVTRSIVTRSIVTRSIVTRNIVTCSIVTCSIVTLCSMTLSIKIKHRGTEFMTFSMTLNITAPSITTLSKVALFSESQKYDSQDETQHYGTRHNDTQ
jgi:hypothetical protein